MPILRVQRPGWQSRTAGGIPEAESSAPQAVGRDLEEQKHARGQQRGGLS